MSSIRTKLARKSQEAGLPVESHRSTSRLVVDLALAIGDDFLLIDGWCEGSVNGEMHLVAAASGSHQPAKGHVPLLRKRRPDVSSALGITSTDLLGFVGCVPMAGRRPSELDFVGQQEKWRVEITVAESALNASRLFQGGLASVDMRAQVEAHVLPVVKHDIFVEGEPVAEVIYKSPNCPDEAAINLVIPVYENFHFLRNQLFAFSALSDDDCGITLVCDDPALTDRLLSWVRGWNATYRTPLRVVAHKQNSGFAAGCNTGAKAIHSDYTVLLNSDVLPSLDASDWIRRLTMPLRQGAAMTAPVLLFPDGSVQHAGMAIEASQEFPGFELPVHQWKGMPRTALPRKPFAAQLLSGAALAIDSGLYQELGGMPTWLGKGDFEDVALSQAARERGELLIVPGVEWTHLEASSYDRSGESDVLLTLAKSLILAEASSGAIHGRS